MLVGQVGYFVLVVSQVKVDVPLQVAMLDDSTVQFQFHTQVAHVADVGIIIGIAIRRRQGEGEQHVAGLAGEEIYATVQTGAKQFKFHTGVEVGVRLPRNVLVTHYVGHGSRIAVGVYDAERVDIAVVTDSVITLRTIGSLDFQQVNPLYIEEGFLGNNPGGTGRPEVTPAIVRMETAGSVAAVRY